MDVEKRVVISAGMDPSSFKTGMDETSAAAAKMAAGVTQSVKQISRELLDSKAGFDALAKNFVDGYRNAQQFAQAIQTAYRSLGTGELGQVSAKMGLLPQMLDNISAKYGIFGEAARQAALKMADATATQAQRLQAFQSLIASAGGQAAPTSSAVPSVAPNVAIVEAYSTALTNLQAKYSPLATAAQTYQTALTGVASAESVGALSATEASAARERASAAYATSAATAATATNALRASIDPVYASSKRYEDELNRITQAEQLNLVTSQRATVLREQATTSFAAAAPNVASFGKNLDQLTGTTWSQQFAMRQLGVQTVQTFSGFATGQPILMTLIQQGHQMIDIMFSAGVGLKAVAQGIWDFTKALLSNPITLFIIGVVALTAALVALVVHAQSAAQRIGDLQNQFRASRGDAEAMTAQVEAAARHLAQTTNLGFTEASKAAADFAKNPAFQGTQQQLEALVIQAHRLSIVLGGDLPAATKILVRGSNDAAAAAKTLLDEYQFGAAQGVTQAWVDNLKQMTQVQAFQVLSDKIAQVTRDAKEHFTNLGQAWDDFKKLLTSDGPGFWTEIGNNIADGLAYALRMINAIIEKWRELKALIPTQESLVGTGDAAREQLKQQGGAIVGGSTLQQQLQQWSRDTFYGGRQAPIAPTTPSTGGTLGTTSLPARSSVDLVSITTKGGVSFQVARSSAANFAGFLNDLEATGYPLQQAQSFGYANRNIAGTNQPSQHAFGNAIDINAQQNPRGASGQQNLPPDVADMARRWGLVWGGTWSGATRDPMHFQVGTGYIQTPQDISTHAQAASTDALSVRMTENLTKQRDATDGLRQARADMKSADAGTPEFALAAANVTRYSEGLAILKGRATDIISEQDKLARSATDAIRPLNAQAGAARSLAEIENQFIIAARSANGGIVDQTAVATALSAEQQKLTTTANDHVSALDRQTNMMNALTTATEQGGAALDHARNFEQALIDVQATSTAGTTEQARQIVAATEAMDRNSEAKRTNAAATDIAAMNKEQELLAAEARLIGESTMAREQELAVIRQRQSYSLAAGDPGNVKQREAIEQRRITAGQIVQNKELEVNYNELASATSQSFQTIGDAIAQAFVSGEGAAVSFQNVTKAVIAQIIQEMIKLSIINPILKSLFPGEQTSGLATATGVFGAIGRAIGGGGLSGAGEAALVGSSEAALTGAVGSGFMSGGLFAKGGVFSGSDLSNYSNSIVASPTLFNTGMPGFMAFAQGGTGMMGEAGPEAIIPLVRGPSGDLGIRGNGGGGGVSVVVNTPITITGGGGGQQGKPLDPQALKALQQSIDQTVRHAVRTTIVDERRPGGDLFFR